MGIDRDLPRAVFLDRDGVINEPIVRDGRPLAPLSDADLVLLPDVRGPLDRLRSAGFRLVVVTNQPEVARGTLPAPMLDRMHARLAATLPIDEFRVCPHDDGDACECRKPKPGLLTAAARDAGIDLAASYMVGDRWRDVDAGRRAGCVTVFVDRGYDEPRPERPDATVRSLGEAADWILSRSDDHRS